MRVEVVDASAVAALYFGEPEADAVAERLSAAYLAAPGLIRVEMSNIALKKIGKNPPLASLMLKRLADFLDSPLEICAIDHSEALALALAARLTAYDASYLWLARNRQCGLVTLDRQLQQAAIEFLSR
jgi:predicted nucleic acid-binding protein